jgi:hypothetical protein
MTDHARTWAVELHDEFDAEFEKLAPEVQDELLAQLGLIEQFGPPAKRPRVDTLKGSKHANMKELRFAAANGAWRLPSIPNERQSCSLPVTSRVRATKGHSTGR